MESYGDSRRTQEYEDQEQVQAHTSKTIDIRELCALCKSMECCPEHCCNWDTCSCSDCEYCRANKGSTTQASADPSILIKSTGQEEVKKFKKPKKAAKDEEVHEKPSEQIRTNDGSLIINYEVPQEDEEVVLAGGIKGIRALRMQRDAINQQVDEDLNLKGTNKFSKYEEQKR